MRNCRDIRERLGMIQREKNAGCGNVVGSVTGDMLLTQVLIRIVRSPSTTATALILCLRVKAQ